MAFLAALADGREAFAALPSAALEDDLRRLVSSGRTAWPAVAHDDEDFVRHVAERVRRDVAPAEALAELHAADLYLAWACAAGDAGALGEFERRYAGQLSAALHAAGTVGATVDDTLQTLRVRLFVGDERKILEYAGRGSLIGWLRVAALRTALRLGEKDREHEPIPDGLEPDQALAPAEPELELIKQHYRADFDAAFAAALASLSSEERTLLRYYVIDRLNIAQIGTLLDVGRSTVGRRIVECRERILDATRRELAGRLGGAASAEVDSIIRLVRSQFYRSLGRVLGSGAP